MKTRAAILCLTVAFGVSAAERPGDWTGPYYACDGHAELSKPGHMSLGVRFATSKARVATAFARAMSFWADVLDMEWHTENGRECAIQVVDGHAGLFASAQSARAQFPTARSFQGWIAFNPRMTLPANELFTTAVHEIGHLLGLPHSANPSSVMYFLYLDGPVCLDSADVSALAARHKLRTEASLCSGPVRAQATPPLLVTRPSAQPFRSPQQVAISLPAGCKVIHDQERVFGAEGHE